MTVPQRIYPLTNEQVAAAYDGSIAVQIGDLMFLDGDDAKPASSQADQGAEAANQRLFARRFLGVSAEKKLAADPAGTIQVTKVGEYDYDCESATWEVGELVTIDEAASGTALHNQKLVKTTDADLAIGYCSKREPNATTRVRVVLTSRVAPPQSGGFAIKTLSQYLALADFTDNTNATGYADFDSQLPAGALVLGWKAEVHAGFAGDTTAVVQVGIAGALDDFSAVTTRSVLAPGTVGSITKVGSGAYINAAVTPRVTVTGGADFTSINAGAMTVTLFYIATQ